MSLYKRLKNNEMVISEKEFCELIYTRQIQINDKRISDPALKLKKNTKYKATIGILTKTI